MNQTDENPGMGIEEACGACYKEILAGLIVTVCAVVLFVHWPVLSSEAGCFDDERYLLRNFLVQNPSWTSVKHFFTEVARPSTVRGYYQPLSMISLMLDCAFGGSPQNFRPFHITSLVLHIANTALIIVLIWLLFGRPWVAAVVGLLFGLHPMTVESIAWISERKTVLSAFFALWCLVFYIWFGRKRNGLFYVGCMTTYILALLAKPISVPLPVAMLLMDYWPLRRLSRQSVLEKIPFFVVAVISAAITYISQAGTATARIGGGYGLKRIGLVVCHNIIFYLYKIIYPANLSSFYPFPKPLTLSQPMILAGVIGSFLLIAMLLFLWRWTKAPLTGWLVFFVMIFPTLGVVRFTKVIAADRFAYLPSVGLLMILAAFAGWFCNAGDRVNNKTRCIVVFLILLVLSGGESVATRRYLVHWYNTESLFKHVLSLAPQEADAYFILGQIYCSRGDNYKGIEQYKQALKYDNNHTASYNNLGVIFCSQGRIDEAIDYFTKAIKIDPVYAEAYYNLGKALYISGKFNQAIEQYCQAIKYNPYYTQAYNQLGIVFQRQGELDKAAEYYYKALKISPNHAPSHNNLGLVLLEQNKPDEAISHFQMTLQLSPDFIQARFNLEQAIKMKNGNK
jgi:Tfp pilus assembly protein PilF